MQFSRFPDLVLNFLPMLDLELASIFLRIFCFSAQLYHHFLLGGWPISLIFFWELLHTFSWGFPLNLFSWISWELPMQISCIPYELPRWIISWILCALSRQLFSWIPCKLPRQIVFSEFHANFPSIGQTPFSKILHILLRNYYQPAGPFQSKNANMSSAYLEKRCQHT